MWLGKSILKGSLRGDHEKKVGKHWYWHLFQFEKETCQTQFVQFVPHLAPKAPPYSSQVLVLVKMDNVIVGDSAPCWDPHSCLVNSPPSLPTSVSLPHCAPQPASPCSHDLSHVCLLSSFQPPGLVISRLDLSNSPLNSSHPLPTPTYLSLSLKRMF